MTTREFLQHLILNSDLDSEVFIEVKIPENCENRFLSFVPTHVTELNSESGKSETLIECKIYKTE